MNNNKKKFSDNDLILGMPDPTVSVEEKKMDSYGLKWGKYIGKTWNTKESTYFRDRFDRISQNRAYATGQQSIVKYKQLVNDANETSWMNLDYEVLSVVPKYVKLIVDYIMGLPEKAKADAVDPLSITEREDYKKELLFRKEFKDYIKQVEDALGIKIAKDDFIPDTMEEIKVYMATKYKQSVVIAINQAIELVFQLNDYPDETKRQIIEDIVVDGYGGTKVWTDPQYGIMIRRVDPLYAVYPPSKMRDMSDIEYAGEIYQMTIYELKRLMSNKYTDEEWIEIAKTYGGKNNYLTNETSYQYSSYTGNAVLEYEKTKVDVLDFAFKTPCKQTYKKKKTKYGKERILKTDTVNKNDESYDYDYEMVFTGMHIMGSDIIFNYKPLDNTTHKQGNFQKAELPYKFYMPNNFRMSNRSYVDFMQVPSDQMFLAHLKIQQMVSQAKPTGLSINLSGLDVVSMGDGGQLSPIEIKDIYDQTGVYYYRSTDEEGNFIGESPIRALPNSIQNLPELITSYNFYLDQIRNITGITPNMEGVIGNRQATATVESSINAATSAISDVAHAYKRITQRTAEHICSAFQDIVEYGKDSNVYKFYKEALGKGDMDVIDSLDDLPLRTFGIVIEVDTDMREQIELEQSIQTALAARTIELQDAMAVRKYAKVDILLASELLELRVKKNKELEQMRQMQMIEAQSQQIQQQAMASSQARQMEMALEAELYKQKAAIDMMKQQQLKMIDAGIESKMSIQEFYQDLQLKTMEANGKAQEVANQNAMAFAKIDYQAERQKELIDKRAQATGKQNTSITELM